MVRPRVIRYTLIGVLTLIAFLLYLHAAATVLQAPTDAHADALADAPDDAPDDAGLSLKHAEADNALRLQRVQTVCRKHNLGLYKHSAAPPAFKHPPTPQYGVFYIDKIHKLSWCPIYKAASSTWLYNLCLLGGYTEAELQSTKKQLSDLARTVYQEVDAADAELAFQNSLKLLVVRHPFARLLSAYRDKLENTRAGFEHGTGHFYRKYGSAIVKKYRHRLYGSDTNLTAGILREHQFVYDPRLPRPVGNEPTFKEFVNYLVDIDLTHYADDHWIPYYLFCTPCLLNYDIIAQVETLNRDQVYVIRSAGIEGLIKPRWTHKTANYQSGEIAKRYFSQLSREEVKKLYEKYKLDFELFGYEMDDYVRLATATS